LRIPLKIRERVKTIEISATDGRRKFAIDGRLLNADSIAIAPGLYSILLDGRSFEAHVRETGREVIVTIDGRDFAFRVEDPREWRRDGTELEAEGRQKVVASMPGKIVRVLAAAGQTVGAGQGLVVIEAMKMQNEVRSPKSGTVERLLVAEGQAVNAGEVLAIVA
jgi:biotin carboxyl carrier protein